MCQALTQNISEPSHDEGISPALYVKKLTLRDSDSYLRRVTHHCHPS